MKSLTLSKGRQQRGRRSPLKQACAEELGIYCGNVSVSGKGHCLVQNQG